MSKKICIMNQKGGVGKTTTTINLGIGLKMLGKKVLLVDMDPQANLTTALGVPHRSLHYSIYDLFSSEVGYQHVMVECHGLNLLPSSMALSGLDSLLANDSDREFILKRILTPLEDQFDVVFIDCPPNLGLLTLNALTASDGILVPTMAEYLPLDGMSYLYETFQIVKERLNANLEILGIIMTKYDERQKLQREVLRTLQKHFGEKLFETRIRTNIALAESPSYGQDIYSYKPNSNGARDYLNLCHEILSKEVV